MCDDVKWTASNDTGWFAVGREASWEALLYVFRLIVRELKGQAPGLYFYTEDSKSRELTGPERVLS